MFGATTSIITPIQIPVSRPRIHRASPNERIVSAATTGAGRYVSSARDPWPARPGPTPVRAAPASRRGPIPTIGSVTRATTAQGAAPTIADLGSRRADRQPRLQLGRLHAGDGRRIPADPRGDDARRVDGPRFRAEVMAAEATARTSRRTPRTGDSGRSRPRCCPTSVPEEPSGTMTQPIARRRHAAIATS